MKAGRSLRVAILAHSTNPRGGVAHALSVAEALDRLGHAAVVHAPDAGGRGFYRASACETVRVPASPVGPSTLQLVETRIADYLAHFDTPAHRRFDVFHAQDGISANALATLKKRRLISGFAYTVHHVDHFTDARVDALQGRAIREADRHFTVSRLWRERLAGDYGIDATVIGNGVDRSTFQPRPDGREKGLRTQFSIASGPVFLSVGGVEARKNTLAILRAFAATLALHPGARLIVAGGASLLDHGAYQADFRAALDRLGAAAGRVTLCGPVDQADMPALFRIADALVFPSLNEGFGLVALEAIACGTPVVTSRIAPFTQHFSDGDVVWCDPCDAASIAEAMARVLEPEIRACLAIRTEFALAGHGWDRTAAAHLPVYEELREVAHA